jgi:hypothetical protein
VKSDTSAFKHCVKVQTIVLVNSFSDFQTVIWARNGNMKTEKGGENDSLQDSVVGCQIWLTFSYAELNFTEINSGSPQRI